MRTAGADKTSKAEGKKKEPGDDLLSRNSSTIGAEELNFRVRDGNGWDLFAMITRRIIYIRGPSQATAADLACASASFGYSRTSQYAPFLTFADACPNPSSLRLGRTLCNKRRRLNTMSVSEGKG